MPNHEQIYMQQAEMYEKLIAKQPSLAGEVNKIRPFQNLDVIDLGAGTGRFSTFLAPWVKSLISTDSSGAMLDVLKKKLRATGQKQFKTIITDHRELPLTPSSADLVVSGWSICYLASSNIPEWKDNLRQIMAGIERILRNDGTIILFETLGTGFVQPAPPDFLTSYYRSLQEEYGFSFKWIRTDYTFHNVSEAEQLTGFFFGEEMAEKVAANRWTVVPECAGIWWKHL